MTPAENLALKKIDDSIIVLMRNHNKNISEAAIIAMDINEVANKTLDINVHRKIDKFKAILRDTFIRS